MKRSLAIIAGVFLFFTAFDAHADETEHGRRKPFGMVHVALAAGFLLGVMVVGRYGGALLVRHLCIGTANHPGAPAPADDALHRLHADVGAGLKTKPSLIEALDWFLARLSQFPGIDSGSVYIVNTESGGLELAAHCGMTRDYLDRYAWLEAESRYAHTVRDGRVWTGNFSELMQERQSQPLPAGGIRTILVVPLRDGDRVIGAFNVASHSEVALTPPLVSAIEKAAVHFGPFMGRRG